MQGYLHRFTKKEELEPSKVLLMALAHEKLPVGTRYELRFDPNPLSDYGHLKQVVLLFGPEFDEQPTWEPVTHAGYGIAHHAGTYLLCRGIIGPGATSQAQAPDGSDCS